MDTSKPNLPMLKEVKLLLFCGAAYLCLGIIIGAFAAHGLKQTLTESQLGVLQTGVKYQLIHGLGLLLLGILYSLYQIRLFYFAGLVMASGVFLFSFSLYALVLFAVPFLGIITPFGGVLMIIAWLLVIYSLVKGQ